MTAPSPWWTFRLWLTQRSVGLAGPPSMLGLGEIGGTSRILLQGQGIGRFLRNPALSEVGRRSLRSASRHNAINKFKKAEAKRAKLRGIDLGPPVYVRSEEHTSELQSLRHL